MKQLNNKIKLISASVVMAMTLSACGGGSGDGNSATTNPTSPNNPTTPTNPAQIECVNGIPKNLKTTGSGFYDQEFFILDTDYDTNDNEQLVINAQQLKNGVLYEYSANLLKNSIKPSLYGGIDYLLTPSKLEMVSKRAETSAGIPLGYVLSQNGDSAKVAMFTDSCSMSTELQIDTHIKRVDLSGKKIAELFAYNTDSSGFKEYKYLSNQMAQYFSENPDLAEKLINSSFTFPQGSLMGFNDQEVYSAPIISFSQDYDYGGQTLDQVLAAKKLNANETWKKDIFAGLNVDYVIDKNTSKYVYPIDPIVEMNGKAYNTEWLIPGNFLEYTNNYETGQEVGDTYFNKTAAQTLAGAINTAQ